RSRGAGAVHRARPRGIRRRRGRERAHAAVRGLRCPWMKWLLLVALAACRGDGSGPTATVVVTAAGAPAAGATVLSHRDDGTAIARRLADVPGRAVIVTEPGAYASVVFPAVIEPSTNMFALVTAPIPASGELDVDGPPAPRVPIVVGALAITAPPFAGADAG